MHTLSLIRSWGLSYHGNRAKVPHFHILPNAIQSKTICQLIEIAVNARHDLMHMCIYITIYKYLFCIFDKYFKPKRALV